MKKKGGKKKERSFKKFIMPEWMRLSAEAYISSTAHPRVDGLMSYLGSIKKSEINKLSQRNRVTLVNLLVGMGALAIRKNGVAVIPTGETDKFVPPANYTIPCKRKVGQLGEECTGQMKIETAPHRSTSKYQARCNKCNGWMPVYVHPAHPVVREL
jgi:hypothetical protein